jgi:hypothetical protein
MLRALGFVFLIALFLSLTTDSWSDPPTPIAPSFQKPPQPSAQIIQAQPKTDNRGTDEAPLVVKVIEAPKTEAQATLEQQERDDKSASDWWLVKLTGALVVVTGLLAIFTALLYAATAKLAKDAKETGTEQSDRMERSITETTRLAAAAEEANRHTLENSQRQLRAYVGFEKTWFILHRATEYPRKFRIKLDVQNFGQSPAFLTTSKFKILLRERESSQVTDFEDLPSTSTHNISVFPRGYQNIWFTGFIENRTVLDKIFAGNVTIQIRGILGYVDVFNSNHFTHFNVSVGGEDFGTSVSNVERGLGPIEWSPELGERHNSTD